MLILDNSFIFFRTINRRASPLYTYSSHTEELQYVIKNQYKSLQKKISSLMFKY